MSNTVSASLPVDRDAALKLVLSKARDDLAMFVGLTFNALEAGSKYQANWHIRAICCALERVASGDCKRLIITMPPRSLKSMTASVAFPAWVLGRNPNTKIICVSYAQPLAVKLSNDCRTIVSSPFYRAIFPDFAISPRKNTENEFQTTFGGSRLATSTGGQLTGRGANIIVIDDPMKADDAYSETARTNIIEWYRSTLTSRLDNPRDGAIVLVMQCLHVDDLAGALLEKDGWEHLNLPAIAEEDQSVQIGPHLSKNWLRGELLHPERLGFEELNRLKSDLGSLGFSAQYLQSPAPTEGNLIKRSWFRTFDSEQISRRSMTIVQSWDTAMKGDPGSDYSVCMTWAQQGSNHYLLDVLRQRLPYPALLTAALEQQRSYWPEAIVIEAHGSGLSLIDDLEHRGVSVVPQNCQGDKTSRLARVSAMVQGGNVYLPSVAPWKDEFLREITSFPNVRHDDQVDAFSQALIYMQEDQRKGGGFWIGKM